MSRSNLAVAAAALLSLTLAGCGKTEPQGPGAEAAANRQQQARARQMKAACSSQTTYDRLKQIVFDEAIRRGSADPQNLDTLSTHSLARVEEPVVKSRDEELDITVCAGALVLTIPPGAERAFAGKRQLTAGIEYAGQAAADGSGLVYRMSGAEPIITALARFDLTPAAYRPAAAPSTTTRATPRARPAEVAAAPPQAPASPLPQRAPPPLARPAPPVQASAAPRPTAPAVASRPSFNCRYARSRSEKLVCGSADLAALDRQMSSQFYAELGRADAAGRAALRRTRDRFLATRDRCDSEACVARAYVERMNEIAAIAGER